MPLPPPSPPPLSPSLPPSPSHVGLISHIFDIERQHAYIILRGLPSSRILDFSRQAQPTLSLLLSIFRCSRQYGAIIYAQSRFLIDATYLRHVSPVAGKTREKNDMTSHAMFRCLLYRHAELASICFLLECNSVSIYNPIYLDNVDLLY